MMMVQCYSWLWQQCSGVSAALLLAAVCAVVVAGNGIGWWLRSGGGCWCDGGCGCEDNSRGARDDDALLQLVVAAVQRC